MTYKVLLNSLHHSDSVQTQQPKAKLLLSQRCNETFRQVNMINMILIILHLHLFSSGYCPCLIKMIKTVIFRRKHFYSAQMNKHTQTHIYILILK